LQFAEISPKKNHLKDHLGGRDNVWSSMDVLSLVQSNLLHVQLIASLVLCLAAKMEQWTAGKVSV
jgi:hypothetical protein